MWNGGEEEGFMHDKRVAYPREERLLNNLSQLTA
jgi:hypothetical protein